MKLPVVIIGHDNLALASLRQQLEKETDFLVEDTIRNFDEAWQALETHSGPVLAIIDFSRNVEHALRLVSS